MVHTQVCLWLVDKDVQTISFRGSKSRNKVSVWEPADGSLSKAKRLAKQERLWYPTLGTPIAESTNRVVCHLHLHQVKCSKAVVR